MGEDRGGDLGMGQQGDHAEAVATLWAGGDIGPPDPAQECGPIKPARASVLAEVTTCPQCGDTLRVLAFLSHPDVTAPILAHLGIVSTIPPLAPARAPPDPLDLSCP